MRESIHPEAFALRPVRIVDGELRMYEGTTFPRGPRAGCAMYVRRLAACGYLASENEPHYAVLDVLAEDGSIVQDYCLTRDGFRYLRRVLGFKVEHATPEARA